MNQAGCAFNLQQLGQGLAGYATRHQQYPDVSSEDAGRRSARMRRSSSDDAPAATPGRSTARARGTAPRRAASSTSHHIDYAYHVGFRPEPSAAAEPITPWLAAIVPLLADQPPHAPGADGIVLAGNSPNHGRRGQNVLFSDLHVAFFNTRQISPVDTDLFLNDQARPEPGLSIHDAVLVHPTRRVELR